MAGWWARQREGEGEECVLIARTAGSRVGGGSWRLPGVEQ
jgi:hypothetical protein